MKKHFLLLSLCCLLAFVSNAQDADSTLVGRKIVSANLNLNYLSNNSNFNNNSVTMLNGLLLIGKIKSNKTYTAYGLRFGINQLSNQSNNPVALGPAFERGKFVKLVDKLYLAPYFGGSLQVSLTSGTPFTNVIVYASPIRFMYPVTRHVMLSASFGSANFSYTRLQNTDLLTLNTSFSNNSSFGLFYTFK